MTQLSYQPAFDPFHAIYRLLRLRESVLNLVDLPADHVRILDYYLLLPFRMKSVRLQPQHRKFKRLADEYLSVKPYGDMPGDRILFNRIAPIQTAAFETLVKAGFISRDAYSAGIIKATNRDLPEELGFRISEDNETQKDLIAFLTAIGTQYELLGKDGLKDRSGLMEFFYDAA